MPKPSAPTDVCAIDFGTSNSAVAVPTPQGVRLARVEGEAELLPTAIFYDAPDDDAPPAARANLRTRTLVGRAAMAAYVAGHDGRLMRSMKSVLGSTLAQEGTDIGHGDRRNYADVIGDFLAHLKRSAEAQFGREFRRAVLGRPVYFVDDDPARDAQAQATLEAVARQVGFEEVQFQLEPLAAAHDLNAQHSAAQSIALICDFGGGTCDFSVVSLGKPGHALKPSAVLAHHGIHVAGTDFDRHISLASIMPLLGHRSITTLGREMPSRVYHDLATWHLINPCYAPLRVAEQRAQGQQFASRLQHERLMRVLNERLGHALAQSAETAKVAAAENGQATLPLTGLDAAARLELNAEGMQEALSADVERIAGAAAEAVRRAQLTPDQVALLYFTGGSSRLQLLAQRVQERFSHAHALHGDSFASVAKGLGVLAAAWER